MPKLLTGRGLGVTIGIQLDHLVSNGLKVAFFALLRANGWAWWPNHYF